MADIFPTWGYKSDGSAQIFNLREEDEDLPEGWSRRLEPWNHPNTRHLYPGSASISEPPDMREYANAPGPGPLESAPQTKPRRGRPPKYSHEHDEQPGAELASELRDE